MFFLKINCDLKYNFSALLHKITSVQMLPTIQMIEEDGEKILVLTGPELLKVLEEHVTSLLKACPGHQLLVPDFLAAYMRHHGHSLSLQDYGVASVVQLIKLIPTVAQVSIVICKIITLCGSSVHTVFK